MKTIICGGRHFLANQYHLLWLNELKVIIPITVVISGNAKGADRFGEYFAITNKLPLKTYPAKWKLYGKGAGMIRNRQMAQIAEACVAFPGGDGTKNMLEQARLYGLKVFEYES